MKTGIELIAEERKRQITEEGWTSDHDAGHINGELSTAAECYLLEIRTRQHRGRVLKRPPPAWPWAKEYWKPSSAPLKSLIKAGALIAAAIDRYLRVTDSAYIASTTQPDYYQLRPITEIPESVPDGCFIQRWSAELGFIQRNDADYARSTHFMIVKLPVSFLEDEAKKRAEFEETMKKQFPEWDFERQAVHKDKYVNKVCDIVWDAWRRKY